MNAAASRPLEKVWHLLRRPQEIWPLFRSYLGLGRKLRHEPIADAAGLAHFLETRATFVAQMSLYTYLRTRAGQRYPVLFENPEFVRAINIAKWQIWLACLGDISLYAGGLLARNLPVEAAAAGRFVITQVDEILARTGRPEDSGPEFLAGCDALRLRLAGAQWHVIPDDATVFVESPPAVVKWAPIVDHLKELDEPIVLNSVRFRWQEIRRDLRSALRYEELAAALRRTPSPT
ncbi:MAG: hypothetical protein ACK4ZN_06020 [Oceanibaculum sp.]